jgi:RNA polymerase sigma-70 factor, ECF subfamily
VSSDRETTLWALKSLQPLHRELIRRAHHLGHTTAEIATDLNIAEVTVKTELHHALRVLRELLAESS